MEGIEDETCGWFWAFQTAKCVVFIERDSKPPCQQSTLKHDQLKEKEFSVCTKVYLYSYWKDVEFDENHIKIEQTNCGGDSLK